MIIINIEVVEELNHPVTFYFEDESGAPFDVSSRTYQMAIRKTPGTPTGEDVVFTCNAVSNRAECVGDCRTLIPGMPYQFQLVENGLAIVSGNVKVSPRLV